jgi:uncharacterized protein YggE
MLESEVRPREQTMTDTVITVRGTFSAFYPAERATVYVGAHHEGPEREPVFAATLASAEAVRASIKPLHDSQAGPVTWWSSPSVQVWNEKPWNNEGRQLPPVFHARADFSVKFSDFDALAAWIEAVATVDGVALGHIVWALTEASITGVTAEVRSRAVKDAVAKASVFAQSIGLGSVTAIAIADPGMLGDQVRGADSGLQDFARMSAKGVGFEHEPALSLKPEEIEVAATVDARFIAR